MKGCKNMDCHFITAISSFNRRDIFDFHLSLLNRSIEINSGFSNWKVSANVNTTNRVKHVPFFPYKNITYRTYEGHYSLKYHRRFNLPMYGDITIFIDTDCIVMGDLTEISRSAIENNSLHFVPAYSAFAHLSKIHNKTTTTPTECWRDLISKWDIELDEKDWVGKHPDRLHPKQYHNGGVTIIPSSIYKTFLDNYEEIKSIFNFVYRQPELNNYYTPQVIWPYLLKKLNINCEYIDSAYNHRFRNLSKDGANIKILHQSGPYYFKDRKDMVTRCKKYLKLPGDLPIFGKRLLEVIDYSIYFL